MAGDQPHMNGNRTFFQQKWDAKSRSRAYHGDHIPEKKWVRLFSRHLQSVVNMPPSYLGANDGSEQAAGRGSGLTTNQVTAEKFWTLPPTSSKVRFTHNRARSSPPKNSLLAKPLVDITPYMQMTFAPLERRLDTAVFRALFASSVRQARQFVIHGAVKVNGKKASYYCAHDTNYKEPDGNFNFSAGLTNCLDGSSLVSIEPGRHVPGRH